MAKDLVIKVDTYTNKNGEQKNRYVKLGVILSSQNGEYAILDPTVNLAGCMLKQRLLDPKKAGKGVMCSIFDNSQQSQTPPTTGGAPVDPDFNDDIPF